MVLKDYIRSEMGSVRNYIASNPGLPACHNAMADERLVEIARRAMTEKLQAAREKGRGGWWNKNECSLDDLRTLLKDHIEKGDMRDVLNLAAMVMVREADDDLEQAGSEN